MATAFHCNSSTTSSNSSGGSNTIASKNRRKGTPVRSPCRRDMLDTPGVVFRFPSLLSAVRATLPSEYKNSFLSKQNMLNSGSTNSSQSSTLMRDPSIFASSAVTLFSTPLAPIDPRLPQPNQESTVAASNEDSGNANAKIDGSDSSSSSTTAANNGATNGSGMDQTTTTSSPPSNRNNSNTQHRHATPDHVSNVLHYPELLSDIRDQLNVIRGDSGILSRPLYHENSSVTKRRSHNRTRRSAAAAAAAAVAAGASVMGHVSSSPGGLTGSGSRRHKSSLSIDQTKMFGPDGELRGSHRHHHMRGRGVSDDDDLDEEDDGMMLVDQPNAAGVTTGSRSGLLGVVGAGNGGSQYQRRHSTGDIDGVSGDDGDGSEEYRIGMSNAAAAAAVSMARERGRSPTGLTGGKMVGGKSRKSPGASGANHSGYASIPKSGAAITSSPMSRRSCASCGVNSTPCWRPGWVDHMTLCNSCGLRYKKGRVFCASCCYVPMKTEIATGGAIICKRCNERIQRTN
ncbi:DNA-binding transcription repressor [Mycoemilia scoparia]|uniref:DNA-binding transcription repressor n=1 Tax=Mycoemilia scoparia TaxID=417184 RepID=A0A9W8A838_9FUNG|nr:DNA-binding transcription repressor [Mycoemilia scoparia]